MRRGALLFIIALLLGVALIPAGATQSTGTEEEPSMEVSADAVSDSDVGEAVEVLETEPLGPTELDYLESINTYAMYIFAFGVVWLILKICSLVYKLLRIFI